MDTRTIIERAKKGILDVPEETSVDPYHGFKIGDRVAYCSIPFNPHLPFIEGLPPEVGFAEWLKLADVGTIMGLVVSPATGNPEHPNILTHSQFWATDAEVKWDNTDIHNPYIKCGLLCSAIYRGNK